MVSHIAHSLGTLKIVGIGKVTSAVHCVTESNCPDLVQQIRVAYVVVFSCFGLDSLKG